MWERHERNPKGLSKRNYDGKGGEWNKNTTNTIIEIKIFVKKDTRSQMNTHKIDFLWEQIKKPSKNIDDRTDSKERW